MKKVSASSKRIVTFLLVLAMLISAGGMSLARDETSVDGVRVEPWFVGINVGGSTTLTATVEPATATNTAVEWSSSDESIATVNAGVVTGRKRGDCVITATTVDGGFTASCNVQVRIGVDSVTVEPASIVIAKGFTFQLDGKILPADTDYPTQKWNSSDDAIAAVSQDGLVTGIEAGNCTVKLTAYDGKNAVCAVTVIIPVDGITISPKPATVPKGGTVNLTATVTPANATWKDVVWSTDNPAIATVDQNGVVTGVSKGSCNITATVKNELTGKTLEFYDTCAVTVTVPVDSVTISPKPVKIPVNDTVQLTANVLPADADDKTVVWTVDPTGIATVSADGLVTGVTKGTCTVTATAGGVSDTCLVEVYIPMDFGLFPTELIMEPKEERAVSLVSGMAGTDLPTVIVWDTADPSIATVDQNGVVTAVAVGTTTITATATDVNSGVVITRPVNVIVRDARTPITGLKFDRVAVYVKRTDTVDLYPHLIFEPKDPVNPAITWVNNSPDLISIDQNGVVTGLKTGMATVLVFSDDYPDVFAYIVVIVNLAP